MVDSWNHQARQNVISKGPLSLSLLWQLLLCDPQLCEMRWVLLFDYICESLKGFYVKLKKKPAEISNLCSVSGIISWAGLFCSLSSCLLKGARTFCCCHIAVVSSWFTSAACKQQHQGCLTSGSFPGKQIRDALRVINRDCQPSSWGWCLKLFALSISSSLGWVEEWSNKQKKITWLQV